MIRDKAGNLYGTTLGGGDNNCVVGITQGCGIVFKISPTGKETVLHTFTGGADGSQPLAGLVADSAGNLYGTTVSGGSVCPNSGCGTVFKITPAGNETILHSFGLPGDGTNPEYGALAIDRQGNLYGTTLSGGDDSLCTYGCGVVFKLDPSGNETILYAFTGGADGGGPFAGVVRDAQGNLYGTTTVGGFNACTPTWAAAAQSSNWIQPAI